MNEQNPETEIQPTSPPPFAGRQPVFPRIQQYLIDPSDRHALVIIGRDGMGKSSILRQCQYVLENNVITCFLSLADAPLTSDDNWLFHLIEQTNRALTHHNFNISRLPLLPDDRDAYREWFSGEYLDEVSKLIRSHRRIVWLMDDAEHLITAVDHEQLPEDTFAYLYSVLEANLQTGIVLSLDEDNEDKTSQLAPLVTASLFQRLHPLSQDDTTHLLNRFGLTLNDDTYSYIYRLTDGHPRILRFLGEALQTIRHETITDTGINNVINTVYQQSQEMYRHIWQNSLSQNERLVLTAISSLLYDDPIGRLTTKRIESWLLETDYPLDLTAVNAGIRGLEYRDLVERSTTDGIRIRGDLFKRWLIEHARMDEVNPTHAKSNANEGLALNRKTLLLIFTMALIVILLVIAIQQSNQVTNAVPQPTVTLSD